MLQRDAITVDRQEQPAQPSLVTIADPLGMEGRHFSFASFLPGETLGRYIDRNGIVLPRAEFVVWHNARPVPSSLWDLLIPRIGDQIVIRAVRPLGGGDGDKVLRSVAMIALVIVSAWAVGPNALALTGWQAAAVQGAIVVAGGALINALLPIPATTAAQLGTGQKYESSPTYSISGGRNRPRPWEPMTLTFGRHKVVPDLGAKVYSEWVGDTQFFNQVFHFGLQGGGDADLTNFRIGATPITDYQGIEIQTSGADGKLSMFAGNVDTLEGFILPWQVVNARTTPLDTELISVDLAAQLFSIADDGAVNGQTVELRIQYRKVGDPAWIDIGLMQDAIYATHYWALIEVYYTENGEGLPPMYNEHQVQFGSANAGDHTDGDEVVIAPGYWGGLYGDIWYPERTATWRWRPHPYQQGKPWYGTAPDPVIGYSSTPGVRLYGARREPTRQSVKWSVSRGQYEIRIWKTSDDINDGRTSNELAVAQILCFQPDETDYTGQLRVALRIQATNQLSGAVDEFSAVAEAKAPVWTGTSWEFKHTRNPAWWFRWYAVGKSIDGKGRQYGLGKSEAELDMDAIKAWGAWCDAKKLTFDYVLDRKASSAQVLQMIARAGRASPTYQTGKLGVIWDAPDMPVVAIFGPMNIVAGSFKIAYINDDTPDEIVLNFANEARDWQMDEVRVKVPGATTTTNPLQLDFEGGTNAAAMGKEANLIAASQNFHRRRTTWETDIEGWVASRGDVVQLSHDLTVWDYSGRFLNLLSRTETEVPFEVEGQTVYRTLATVRVSLTGTMPSGGSGFAMLRDPEGNMETIAITTDVGDIDEIELSLYTDEFKLPGDEYYEGVRAMDWMFFFGPEATPGRRFKIVDVQPVGSTGVRFSAVDDDPEYYASENDPYQYTPPRDGALLGGVVFGVTVTEGIVNVLADINSVQIGWALSVAMPVDVVIAVNGAAQPAVRIVDRKMTIQAQTGDVLDISITPVSAIGRGKPAIRQYTVQGLTAPLPAVEGLTNVFRDGLTALVWNRVVDVRQPQYEVRIGESWANSRTVAVTPMLESLTVGNGLYWVAARYEYKGRAIYGESDSLSVSGAALVRNVLVTHAEAPAWTGAQDQLTVVDDELTLAGSGDILAEPDVLAIPDIILQLYQDGIYTSAHIVDIGYVAPVRLVVDVEAYAINYSEDILAVADILAMSDVLNESSARHWRAQPQYRIAGDDGVYGDWHDYTASILNARYFQMRLLVASDEPNIVPYVVAFTWSVDVPDVIQKGEELSVPAGGLRVTYPRAFHVAPNVQIATFDAVDGDRYVLTSSDETGFNIRLYNGPTAKAGLINWLSQGY